MKSTKSKKSETSKRVRKMILRQVAAAYEAKNYIEGMLIAEALTQYILREIEMARKH